MNWKTWTPLVAAIVLGLGAAKLAKDLVGKRNGERPQTVATNSRLVVAKHALTPGQALTEGDLGLLAVGVDKVPVGAFAEPAVLVGRVPVVPIVEGQPIFTSLLADARAGSGLQSLLPDGTRAITVEVNEVSGVGGLLLPGCRVDLVASLHGATAESLVTRTIVQNVKVVAVGQRLSEGKPEEAVMPRSVTLVVTPEQAETIELASMSGRPRLVLRPGTDNQINESDGTTMAQLVGGAVPASVPPTAIAANPVETKIKPTTPIAVAQRTVTVIRGSTESTVTFPPSGVARAQVNSPAPKETYSHTDQSEFPKE